MDEILGQVLRPPVQLKEFLEKYKKDLKTPYNQLHNSGESIQDVMKLKNNQEYFEELESQCCISNLQLPDDPRVVEHIPGYSEVHRTPNNNVPEEALSLKTYSMLFKSKKSRKCSPFIRSRDIFPMLKEPPKESPLIIPEDAIPGYELKVYVRIYRPARATHRGQTIERPVFSEEFECLGSNFLTELRDKISCLCNKNRFFDISENPDTILPTKESDPGYFFINDTFYNDYRNPLNVDYSETIRNWAKKAKGLSKLEFKVASMEQTRFLDLTVSLGFPQLYQHHGNCEHVFTFSQLEVIANPETQLLNLEHYPFLKSICRFNSRVCNMCGRLNFVFVVRDSSRQLHDPAYLCRKCFISFHYIDGKKIGKFKAYRLSEQVPNQEQELPEIENEQDIMEDDEFANDTFNYDTMKQEKQ